MRSRKFEFYGKNKDVVIRRDGATMSNCSRLVYYDIFNRLSACALKRCLFPTITCNQCKYEY